MLRGKKVDREAPVINHSAGGMFAIRDGRWKLVAGNGSGGRQQPRGKPFQAPYQLFDLDSDLSETKDVAKQHPEIVQRLTEKLEGMRQRGRSVDR
jgi:arylsulfatase A-like enzyme